MINLRRLSNNVIITATIISLGVTTVTVLWWIKRKNKVKIPKEWRDVGKLSEIMIYPMKAGKAILLDKAECTDIGLKEIAKEGLFPLRDRIFMGYMEETGIRICRKTYPIVTLIEVKSIGKDVVQISAPGVENLLVKLPHSSNRKVKCEVFKDVISETIDCGDEAAQWLSNLTLNQDKGVRLGFYAEEKINKREVNGILLDYKKLYPVETKYLGAYAFMASYLLISESSLDDLNSKLPEGDEKVRTLNFRGNLTVSGTVPYSEDDWKWIKIGKDVILRRIKPCTRCLVITKNPNTEEFRKNMEPLKTLRKYRVIDDPVVNKIEKWDPVFGQYFGLHKNGEIKLGDSIFVGYDN